MKKKKPDIIELLRKESDRRRELREEYFRKHPLLTDEAMARIHKKVFTPQVEQARRRKARIYSILEVFRNAALSTTTAAILLCALLIYSGVLARRHFSKPSGVGAPNQSARVTDQSLKLGSSQGNRPTPDAAPEPTFFLKATPGTDQAPVKIEGKDVYVLRFRGQTSAHFVVEGQKRFRLVVANVPTNDAAAMRFQRKQAMLNQSDSDVGPIIFPSSSVSWTMEGTNNYLAIKSFETGTVLANTPGASVLLIEEGLVLDTVLKQLFPRSYP